MKNLIVAGVIILILLIIFMVALTQPFQEEAKIVFLFPEDNSQSVNTLTEIKVGFSRPLTLNEQKLVKITSSPEITGQLSFLDNNQTAAFTPSSPLKDNQCYQITASFKKELREWSFTTNIYENMTPEEQAKLQIYGDKVYAEEEQKAYITYPFLTKLPIVTEKYFIYFDTDLKKFVIKLYARGNKSLLGEYQKAALEALREQQIETEPYETRWVEVP